MRQGATETGGSLLVLMRVVDYVNGGLFGDEASVLDGDRVVDVGQGNGVDGGAVGAAVLGPNPIENRLYAG